MKTVECKITSHSLYMN